MIAALSLLLCVATVAAWVRSYWAFDGLHGWVYQEPDWGESGMAVAWTYPGNLIINWPDSKLRHDPGTKWHTRWVTDEVEPGTARDFLRGREGWVVAGLGYIKQKRGSERFMLWIPFWMLTTLTSVCQAGWMIYSLYCKRRRAVRLRSNLCPFALRPITVPNAALFH